MYRTLLDEIENLKKNQEKSSQEIASLKAKLGKGHDTDDLMEQQEDKSNKQVDRYRRLYEAMRKKFTRQMKHVTPTEERRAVTLEHFKRPDPDSEATIVMSTVSIAEENEHRAAILRAADPESPGSSGEEILPDANALDPNAPPSSVSSAGGRSSRRGSHHSYSNCALTSVQVTIPGPNRPRGGTTGGTEKSDSSLLGKVMVFFTSNASIKNLAYANPAELAAAATTVRAEFAPRKGYGYRTATSTGAIDKPINAVGYISRKTLTHAIHASLLALDLSIRNDDLVKTSDVLTVNFDISTFNQYSQLGVVLHLMHIEDAGLDALGQQLHKVRLRSVCLNSLPVTDKISVDVAKEDGSLFDKEVPCRIVMELAMSGHLWDVLNHTCAFWGMDRGSECAGAGKGQTWARMRRALLGRGGPLEQIFGTRESLHAAMKGEHADFLNRIMQFFGSSCQLHRFPVRRLPSRPDTSQPVMSLPFDLVILDRRYDDAQKVKTVISRKLEKVASRISTLQSSLSAYPLIPECPASCYCDKHMLDRAGVAWIFKFKPILKNIMFCISAIRIMGNHLKLLSNFERVVGLKNARPAERLHKAAAEALGETHLRSLISRFPRKLPRQEQAVESRWNMVQTTVTDMDFKRLVLVLLFIIAFAEGTEEHKIEAVKSVCSKKGFTDERKIRFDNPKIGTCFHYLNSPVEILYMAATSLVHVLGFQPLLAASAHRRECGSSSMRGLGSLVRVVDLVLRKLLFTNITSTFRKFKNRCLDRLARKKNLISKERVRDESTKMACSWHEVFKLGHRGLPSFECNGEPWLSARLERVPKGSKDPDLLHLYGIFYTPQMATIISHVRNTISAVCSMETAEQTGVLSPAHRELYKGEQTSLLGRISAAQFLVRLAATSAADCIWNKACDHVIDPLGHLAGIYDVLKVRLVLSELELNTDDSKESIFFVATEQAIASANILLVQMRELLKAHGEGLHELLNEPLKTLIKDCLPDLAEFAAGKEVDYRKHGTLVSPKRKWFPRPVMAIGNGRLAKLALMAGARPTNNNCVESRWSFLTFRYHAMVRNATAQYMSAVFRKQDFVATGSVCRLQSEHFERIFATARQFMRNNKSEYQAIYRNNQEESERKLSRKKIAKESYDVSNIKPAPEKKDKMTKNKKTKESNDESNIGAPEKKRAGAKAAIQASKAATRGEPMTRHYKSESEQSSDSEVCSDDDSFHSSDSSWKATSEPDTDTECDPSATQYDLSDSGSGPSSEVQELESSSLSKVVESSGTIGAAADADASISSLTDGGQQGVCEPEIRPFEKSGQSSRLEVSSVSKGIETTENHGCSSLAIHDSGAHVNEELAQRQHCTDDANHDDSDLFTDLPDGCFDSEEDEKEEGEIAHPFPDPKVLTAPQAQKASRWKLDYIWYLLKANKWSDCMVEAPSERKNKAKILHLTRMDQAKFPLLVGNNLFYVLYGDSGMELINVESIMYKILDSEQDGVHRLLSSKKPAKQWCVTYSRCLHTKKAIVECDRKNDFSSANQNGMMRPMSLGSESLKSILERQPKGGRLIFHKGDVPYETAAKYIVGFVGWDSMSSEAESQESLSDLLRKINSNLCKQTNLKIQNLSEIDWVYCGQDFSEKTS